MDVVGDVRGRRAIRLDDMVDTGGSRWNAAKALVGVGGVTEVYACASHGVLSPPAIERINESVLREVVYLDTIPMQPGVSCDKIKYVSAAKMFSDAIEYIYEEVSVSRLFL